MRSETITESNATDVSLTDRQAEELRLVGRRLAARTEWWGDSPADIDTRTVVRCDRSAGDDYAVRVDNAIGVIAVDGLQIQVEPKIPLPHLLYLIARSDQIPRLSTERTHLDRGDGFFLLVALWFLDGCERVLRGDLAKSYGETTEELRSARGRIDPVATTTSLMTGRATVLCTYDRFTQDTPFNRLLRHALRLVVAASVFPVDVRQRARRIEQRFGRVGRIRQSDLAVRAQPPLPHYRNTLSLARLLVESRGIGLDVGGDAANTFLFRTPEAVEEGVRQQLKTRLEPRWRVEKKGRRLGGLRQRSVNPDLVFDRGLAVGDVKYRLSVGSIPTAYLYQVASFATAFGSRKGAVIEFGTAGQEDSVELGELLVGSFVWNISVDPATAAEQLAGALKSWLASDEPQGGPGH